MWYEPPPMGIALCIHSITPAETEGMFLVDMQSWYEPSRQAPLEVDQETVDFITVNPYQVPMCPPGWPDTPEPEPEVAD